jgi:3-oxoacyl-[acyl-carrier-protein] synthase III
VAWHERALEHELATAGPERPLARIVSTGAYVPARVLTNHELSTRVETSDAWIVERTGIRERRIAAAEEQASDLAVEAARRALEGAGLEPAQLAMIVVGTISADQRLPSCAAHVQRKLGASCPAFDVAAACAGFLYGLDLACRFVATGCRPVLVVGVELLSRLLDWSDRETCVLFGDGAGAAVVDRSDRPGRGVLSSVLGADGRAAGLLQIPNDDGVVRMRGREVFRVAVTELSAACEQALEAAGLAAADVDHAVLHQANRRILEAISRRVGIPWDRFHVTIDRYGNTSSASIPLGLDDARRQGKIRDGQVVLMAALGAGAAWAASVVRA